MPCNMLTTSNSPNLIINHLFSNFHVIFISMKNFQYSIKGFSRKRENIFDKWH
jgi:hypothetical protein